MKTLRSAALLAAVVGALALGGSDLARSDEAMDMAESDRPFVVEIYADWCGTCTRLEPTWKRIEAELGGQVRTVVLDVTDRARVERSARLADELGLRAFFDAHKSQTGTVGVLTSDGEPVAVYKGELDFDKYAGAVARASGS